MKPARGCKTPQHPLVTSWTSPKQTCSLKVNTVHKLQLSVRRLPKKRKQTFSFQNSSLLCSLLQEQLTVIGWLEQPLRKSCCRCLSHWPSGLSSTTVRTNSSVALVSLLARGSGAAWNQPAGHSLDRHRDTQETWTKF